MRARSLKSVCFANYHRFLQAAVPVALSTVVYGGEGDLVWSSDDDESRRLVETLAALPVPLSQWLADGESVRRRSLDAARVIYGIGLDADASQPGAVLAVLVAEGATQSPTDPGKPIRDVLAGRRCLRAQRVSAHRGVGRDGG